MGFLGDILSLPVNVVNLPFSVADSLLTDNEREKIFSAPLKIVANEIKKIDD